MSDLQILKHFDEIPMQFQERIEQTHELRQNSPIDVPELIIQSRQLSIAIHGGF